MERLMTLAKENGFSHWAPANLSAFRPLPSVREMCAADRCGQYGKNWACPPRCGSLARAEEEIRRCRSGILVQTTGSLADEFDYQGAWPGSTKKPLRALPGRPGCCIRTAWPLRQGPAPFAADVPAHRPLAVTRPGGCRPWRPMACGSAIYAANRAWNIITAHRP
jgi:hypothetical protein